MSEEFFGYEDQEPKNNVVAFLLVASSVVLVITFGALAWFFGLVRDREVTKKLNESTYVELQSLHKDEDAKLTSYQYLDKEKGVVRIPVEHAMQLIAEEARTGAPKPATPASSTKAMAGMKPAAEAKPAAPEKQGDKPVAAKVLKAVKGVGSKVVKAVKAAGGK